MFHFFFYQFDGFADVIINVHLKGEKCFIEVNATSMNSEKGTIIAKCVILMSMT